MVAKPWPDERTIDVEEIEPSVAGFLERVSREGGAVVRRNGVPLVVITPSAASEAVATTSPRSSGDALLREVSALFAEEPLDEIERRVAETVRHVRQRRRQPGESPRR